jgi:adenine-specific DNA-methyltransferase
MACSSSLSTKTKSGISAFCSRAFSRNYLRHMVSAVINPKGTGKLNFARVDEYIFFCVPNLGKISVIKGIPTMAGTTGAPGEGALFYPSSTPQPFLDGISAEEDAGAEDEDDEEMADAEDDTDVADVADEELPFPPEEIDEWELRHARRRGSESSYRHQRKNQFYPISINPKERLVVRAGPALLPVDKKPSFAKVDGLLPVWPIDKDGNERCWRFISPKMQGLIDAGRVRLGKYNVAFDSWTLNIWERKPESKKLKTVCWKKSHDAGTHGTTLLHTILGRRATFPFPKSIYSVADARAAVARTRPNALIVDFFAGSGTTLQSTCMLNAVYGGQRRCILVTNNEVDAKLSARLEKDGIEPGSVEYEKHGICAAVTWPRIETVLTGWVSIGKDAAGHETFVDVSSIRVVGAIRRAWFKSVYVSHTMRETDGPDANKWWSASVHRRAFNCGEETTRSEALTVYYEDGTNGSERCPRFFGQVVKWKDCYIFRQLEEQYR